jgi:uncharacterized paraquat-inducible protein A
MRCHAVVARCPEGSPGRWSASFALAGLLLFPAAMSLPILEIVRLGHARPTTIWGGVRALADDGQPALALLVFFCSIIAPAAKLLAILALSLAGSRLCRPVGAFVYRGVEWVGRWGMLDVLLVALLVATIKIGDLVRVHAGPGALAFAALVVCSLLASASFDPHALWGRAPLRAPSPPEPAP